MRWLLIAALLWSQSWAADIYPVFKDITAHIVQAIERANQCVLVQAYGFTSEPIIEALQKARTRGVVVRVIVDKSQRKSANSHELPIWIDGHHAIAHNKIIIIDNELVITGSFNFTYAAEHRNAENAIFVKDTATAKAYTENWMSHFQHVEVP